MEPGTAPTDDVGRRRRPRHLGRRRQVRAARLEARATRERAEGLGIAVPGGHLEAPVGGQLLRHQRADQPAPRTETFFIAPGPLMALRTGRTPSRAFRAPVRLLRRRVLLLDVETEAADASAFFAMAFTCPWRAGRPPGPELRPDVDALDPPEDAVPASRSTRT